MSVPVIAFFNNKGGVGKTSMVYHLAWMMADMGVNVLAADLDPQSNLTAGFLREEKLELFLDIEQPPPTLFNAVEPLRKGIGDVGDPHVEMLNDRLGLILGDMALSTFEDQLSEVWPKCLDRDERAFRVMSAFWRILQTGAKQTGASIVLIDVGPNLGAINRAALIASDFVVIPLGPDLFSLKGLENLGPRLRAWRGEWGERLERNPVTDLRLPSGKMEPLGYVILRHSIRLDRPVQAFERWMAKIPVTYSKYVLASQSSNSVTVDDDPNCIAKLRDYRSLMPLALEARKPMFHLRAADGALGAHSYAVSQAYEDFKEVALKVAHRASLALPV